MKKTLDSADVGMLTKQKKLILWIMKKSLFFFIALFSITSFGYTQNFSLNLGKVTLHESFDRIKKAGNVTMFYSDDELNVDKLVRVKFTNKTALEMVSDLVGPNFEVKLVDNSVILIVPISKEAALAIKELADITVTGKVTGELGENLPGASVKIKGTNKVVSTDVDGSFSIVAKDTDVLVVSFIGYTTKEVPVGSQKQFNIRLKPAQNELSDIVVIGYQKAHKKNVNAAVASISSKQLESIPVLSVSALIASLSTGVMTPTQSGAPGARGSVVIRGNSNVSGAVDGTGYSNPLYVIDGVQTSLEDLAGYNTSNTDFLASLNPNDIESIDMLKDASAAAIYGSRGANGVIIITTKKGTALDKPEFNFTMNTGVTPIPELVPMLVGSAERNAKMGMIDRWWKTGYAQSVEVPIMLSDSLNPAFNNNVDYQGLFYRTGLFQKYNLSVRGGSEVSNYRVSLGYDNVEGVIQNSGFKRYTFTTNLNSKIGKKFENQLRINAVFTDNQTGQGNPDQNNYQFNTSLPTDPADLNSSLFYLSDAKKLSFRGELSEKLNTDEAIQTTFSNLSRFDFTNALSLSAQFSFVYSSQKKNFYEPSTLREEGDGFASYALYTRKNLSSDIYLNYFKKIKDHTLSAVLGTKTDYNKFEDMGLWGQGFGVDAIQVINDRYTTAQINGYTKIESNALQSYFGRFGYQFKDRYMVNATLSRDGSSRFGKNVRYANFSAVDVGWVFSDEPFIKDNISSILSYGKFRASYGVNGKQFTENFLRYGSYSLGYGGNPLWSNLMAVSTYGGVSGVVPNYNTLGNPELSWENSKQWDLGLDLDFFNNRLNITFDAYNKKTDKLLFDILLPQHSGFNKTKDNVVGVMNYGWESMFKWQVFPRANDWNLELTLGLTQNKNYVTKLPNNNKDYYGVDPYGRGFGYVVGLPLNLPVLFINDYILDDLNQLPTNPFTGQPLRGKSAWSTIRPGFPIWEDLNGDYLLDELGDEKLYTEFKATPDITGSFNLNLKYKGWYLQAYSQFSFGSDIMNSVLQNYMDRYDRGDTEWAQKGLADLSNESFWQQPGDGAAGVRFPAMYPSVTGLGPFYRFRGNQTLWIESGDFWKISQASFGYTFDKSSFLDKLNLTRVRVYANVLNPYQWQRSKSVTDASQVDEHGYTLGNGYPQAKTISFGLDIKF
ncbi:SusC/RagA family TonB-linked outer membrane protein [Flavobacterium rhamnosiphilum]|uniref:SusC/RagA family TonB-linked outer membrane protein n=1 Tax=Flavobacterium rhamnosiphilum TaxID=2541724 RepID=A0A4R5FC86_9FLAO|nr:SusC/RagA family TonB-linked outer membrane protein [Flavobacterium rhamnosiphilum]TDE46577.1 SusC/RagA family TonB-linked outer membrane protein [Flavobacterium rhamnosiphilum]